MAASDLAARVRKAWSANAPLLEPWAVAGWGIGVGTDGVPYTELWLAHDTRQAAQANESILVQRLHAVTPIFETADTWAALYRDIETRVDGKVLQVRLVGDATWFADPAAASVEALLAHR